MEARRRGLGEELLAVLKVNMAVLSTIYSLLQDVESTCSSLNHLDPPPAERRQKMPKGNDQYRRWAR